jgi:hypothetical protein
MWRPYFASASDLTFNQVVRCSPDFYKPFEFMKVDQRPIMPQPWQADCFAKGRLSREGLRGRL